jgi:hypothetical protein
VVHVLDTRVSCAACRTCSETAGVGGRVDGGVNGMVGWCACVRECVDCWRGHVLFDSTWYIGSLFFSLSLDVFHSPPLTLFAWVTQVCVHRIQHPSSHFHLMSSTLHHSLSSVGHTGMRSSNPTSFWLWFRLDGTRLLTKTTRAMITSTRQQLSTA